MVNNTCNYHQDLVEDIVTIRTVLTNQTETLNKVLTLLNDMALSKQDRENIHRELNEIKVEIKELRVESNSFALTREKSFAEVFQKILLLDTDLRAAHNKIREVEINLEPLTKLSLKLEGAWKLASLLWAASVAASSGIAWFMMHVFVR